MSTLIEDRLAAALQARAETVGPEDLRPLVVPETRRRSWPPVLAGLAAAATVAAVAVPLATGGSDEDRPAPPASSATPSPSAVATPFDETTRAEGDVDGDGAADLVRTDQEGLVRVDLADGSSVELQQPVGAGLEGLAEVGAPGLAIVLGIDSGDERPAQVLRWVDGQLEEVDALDDSWIGSRSGQTFWVEDHVLYTGVFEGTFGDEPVRVATRAWELRDGVLQSNSMGQRCWEPSEKQPHPVSCSSLGSEYDVGPRGDLPMMFPAVEESVGVGEPVSFALESEDDSFELRGELPEGSDTVKPGMVELVVTVGGVEHTAPIPAGWTPRLSVQTVVSRGTPGFLVIQEGGDSSTMTVYSFWNGKLQPLGMPSGVAFGSGFQDGEAETLTYRTWITEDGVLFTAEEVDPGAGLHRLFTWSDDLGDTMVERDLGEVCIDWLSTPPAYGRCP